MSASKPDSSFLANTGRRIYNPLGFQKGYNFALFFIFGGALFAFALARTPYLNNAYVLSKAGPGEKYFYLQTYYNIGIQIHLCSIVPASLLVVWQFVPAIRYRALLFHRINGYIILLLLLTSNVSAVLIVRRAFGGTLATQAIVGVLALSTTASCAFAYISIKQLRIDRPRAWMLRTWVWAASIITTRIVMIISTQIISSIGSYYIAMPCAQIAASGGDVSKYTTCRNGDGVANWTVVHANFGPTTQGIEEVAATFQLTFGMAVWISWTMHVSCGELYLHLTRDEGERLRKVGEERKKDRRAAFGGDEEAEAPRAQVDVEEKMEVREQHLNVGVSAKERSGRDQSSVVAL